MPESQDLSADEIAAQAAALAAHLQRSGLSFLPQPDQDAVESLRGRFAAPASDSPIAPASDSPVAPTPAVEPPAGETPRPTPPTATRPPSTNPAARSQPAARIPTDPPTDAYPGEPLGADQRQIQLNVIAEEVAACTRCEVLAGCRNQTVFGEGSPTPRVAFFGEGPGADEDRTGRPFVGRAGQLLTKMIEACSFRREDVYILNTVKCRPPGNRNPEPDEIGNCRTYFERQLSILRPEYIVCLGAIGSQTLLQSKLSVGRMRGKLHRYFDSKVLVTYHPAYLLRNPAAKKAAWEDLQLMLRDAGIDPKAC